MHQRQKTNFFMEMFMKIFKMNGNEPLPIINDTDASATAELTWWKLLKRLQYDKSRDTVSDTRNVLLIVAALIATVTFQAGVNPPGGVWQDSSKGHVAGRAIYAQHELAFRVFLICNTLSLSASLFVIGALTYKFPFCAEIWIATASMLVTYGSAIFAVTPHEAVKYRYLLAAAGVPVAVRFLIEVARKKRARSGPD